MWHEEAAWVRITAKGVIYQGEGTNASKHNVFGNLRGNH